jgi:hypothetical protein
MTNKRNPISKRIRVLVFERDNFQCCFCGDKPPNAIIHVDHIIPRSRGGPDTLNNFATLCEDCNKGKSDLYLGDYTHARQRFIRSFHPPLDYQLFVLRQIFKYIPTVENVKRFTLVQLLPLLPNQRLRDGIMDIYEPITFSGIADGFITMLQSGELTFDDVSYVVALTT